MIKIRIKNADHEIDVQFPISENALYAKLAEIHAIEGKDAPQSAFVTEVYWPEEFSMLKDRFANLDELNYLARRMGSFDTLEYDQFLIGISKLDSKEVKDLINLTFNLHHFTLCKDVSTDTKGDVMRNYGNIAKAYGYHVSVIDLRNPTRSNGNNLLHLVNKYMDLYQSNPDMLVYKAKAEKYAKIISKTIILSGMDAASFGQNAYFYDAAEGLLTATILLVAEFCKPEERHIVSVFKIIQELLAPSGKKGKNQFQQLMEMLPNDHKAKWFAGAALNTAEQSMASVMSTALSRLNSFLDSELEQLLCFDTEIDAEKFCCEKSAIFIIMPEENPNTFFMISLIIQQLYREILAVADENGGQLKNRCVFFCDEFGTLPKIESAEMMFSASRSRRLQIVPIIQSFAQLEKNYGKEGG